MKTRTKCLIGALALALGAFAYVNREAAAISFTDMRRSVANLVMGNGIVATGGTFLPSTDDNVDIGSASAQFKDGYFDGTVNADALGMGGSLTLENGEIIGNAVDAAVTVTYNDDAPELADLQVISTNISTEDNNYLRQSFWMLDDSNVGGQTSRDIAHIEVTGTDITSTTLDSDISFAVVTAANATAPVEVVHIDGAAVYPETDDGLDLGKTGTQFKDAYIDGTANVDTLSVLEHIMENTAVSLTSPTVTFSAANQSLITLQSDANQTGAGLTGGTAGQIVVLLTGTGSNTIRFDDGTANMILGGNITLTEGQSDTMMLLAIDGTSWALLSDGSGN